MLRPFRARAFRLYAAGQFVSVTCSWAQVVALSWIVLRVQPAALGAIVALQFVPMLVLAPWFGAVADRMDRRNVLVAAEATLGVIAVAYAGLALSGRLTIGWVGVLALAWGIANALDTPARRALLPELTAPDDATRAAALAGAIMMIGMTAGSALGGLLVGLAGPSVVFLLNAGSFFADVLVLQTIRASDRVAAPRVPHQSPSVRAGLLYVSRTPALRHPLISLAIVGTFAFTFPVTVPLLAGQLFGGSPQLVGAFLTATSAGSLAGTLIAASRSALWPKAQSDAAAIMALAMGCVALAPTTAMAVAGLATMGAAFSVFVISTIDTLRRRTDPTMLGRVMALFAVLLLGSTPIGGPLAAFVASSYGVRAAFVMGAAAAAIGAVSVGRRAGKSTSVFVSPEAQADRSHQAPADVDLSLGSNDGSNRLAPL